MNYNKEKCSQWTEYYLSQKGNYLFPNEQVIRIFLGNYPELSLDKDYKNKRCLDVSCGDGRNIVLLERLGFEAWGSEISEQICLSNKRVIDNLLPNNSTRFCISTNDDIKFDDHFFDYLLAWNSIYYLSDPNQNIIENIEEHSRVLKKGGFLICSIPTPKCYSLQNGKKVGREGNWRLNPVLNTWGGGLLQNTIIHKFETFENIEEKFGNNFTNSRSCVASNTCFGQYLEHFIFVCQKK